MGEPSADELLVGARAALSNAARLLRTAENLHGQEDFDPALTSYLAEAAMEEAGKACLLHERAHQLTGDTSTTPPASEWRRFYSRGGAFFSHKAKLQALANEFKRSGWGIRRDDDGGYQVAWNVDLLGALSAKESRLEAERALYVDWDDVGRCWRLPDPYLQDAGALLHVLQHHVGEMGAWIEASRRRLKKSGGS